MVKKTRKQAFRTLADGANKEASSPPRKLPRLETEGRSGGSGGGGDRERGGDKESKARERRRSLALQSDLPTPYLVVTNLPTDVTQEELLKSFR